MKNEKFNFLLILFLILISFSNCEVVPSHMNCEGISKKQKKKLQKKTPKKTKNKKSMQSDIGITLRFSNLFIKKKENRSRIWIFSKSWKIMSRGYLQIRTLLLSTFHGEGMQRVFAVWWRIWGDFSCSKLWEEIQTRNCWSFLYCCIQGLYFWERSWFESKNERNHTLKKIFKIFKIKKKFVKKKNLKI